MKIYDYKNAGLLLSVDKRFKEKIISSLTFSGFCFVMCKTCGKMKERQKGKYTKTVEGIVEVLKESMEC